MVVELGLAGDGREGAWRRRRHGLDSCDVVSGRNGDGIRKAPLGLKLLSREEKVVRVVIVNARSRLGNGSGRLVG